MVFDVLLPLRCAGCGRAGAEVCRRCLRALVRLRGPRCGRCGAPTAWPVERCAECAGRRLPFTWARAAVLYEGPAPRIVLAWKEGGLRRLAGFAADVVATEIRPPPAAAIAFVPPDPDRGLRRGRHPAYELAVALGRLWDLPVIRALTRARPARPQRGLTLAERRRNVRHAFAAAAPVPTSVCLEDDEYTTGATAGACATALRAAGASRIQVITFARAVR